MVRVTNNLTVAARIIKINMYDLGTLQPGQSIDVPIEAGTTEIRLEEVT